MIRRAAFPSENSPANTESSPPSPVGQAEDGPRAVAKTKSLTPIRSDHSYSLDDFRRRTGLGRNGLRAARKKGLPVRKCGRNRYVLGADWHEFLRAQPASDD
jgi:hypothetical protein